MLMFIFSVFSFFVFIWRAKSQEIKNDITKTNLIFIMYDDLRTELSIYGREHMITPNFERLAKQSVVFDHCYSQIAVCNPSRDSLMTGLRPDVIAVYNFQHSYRPHVSFPTQLVRNGFNTAGYGKVFHWETPDRDIWSYDSWENNWYNYQSDERSWMNSSTMPDKHKKEEHFRDYEFTTRMIDTLRKLSQKPEYYMVSIGFKLPHLAVHVPYKYYDMYKGKSNNNWALTKKELRFPPTSQSMNYRCCPEPYFMHMTNEGSVPSSKHINLGDINFVFTEKMHDELMIGYAAAITFLDVQLGRILDVVDELRLWNNVTIILSADHGMHNGEKGMWEKWTLFDESTRIPLLISHPQSPHKGLHYPYPVELVDIYPTIADIMGIKPYDSSNCPNHYVCKKLSGKSLAPVVLGKSYESNKAMIELSSQNSELHKVRKRKPLSGVDQMLTSQIGLRRQLAEETMLVTPKVSQISNPFHTINYTYTNYSSPIPPLQMTMAISQTIRCADKLRVMEEATNLKKSIPGQHKLSRQVIWFDCDVFATEKPNEMMVIGYSVRTNDFRYNAWFHFNRKRKVPLLDVTPFAEELYDHRGEVPQDYTHLEIVNLVNKGGFEREVLRYRERLIAFIRSNIAFASNNKP